MAALNRNGHVEYVLDKEDDDVDCIHLLLILAIAANVWTISSIVHNRRVGKVNLLVLHLSAGDLIHDFHSATYTVITLFLTLNFDHHLMDEFMVVWHKHNLYFGCVLSYISILATIQTLVNEIVPSKEQKKAMFKSSWSNFLLDFATSHGKIWTCALISSMPILIWGQHFQGIKSVLECELPSTVDGSFVIIYQLWKFVFQTLSHTLWFPMLCLAVLPIVAFALIRRTNDDESEFRSDRRITAALVLIYYSVFFYDLVTFAKQENDQQQPFSHTQRQMDGSLLVIYVFHHWSRPLAAILRNAFITFLLKNQRTYHYNILHL